jgi:hypothetical protein
MSSSHTPEGSRDLASASANAPHAAPSRIGQSSHSLAADLFKVAAPLLTRDELSTLAGRHEDVEVQLDYLSSLAVLLAHCLDTLEDSAQSSALFALAAGIETASTNLSIANAAAAALQGGVQ